MREISANIFAALAVLFLTACASTTATPTPTVLPQRNQPAPVPTATRIPLPSPTATLTPWFSPTAAGRVTSTPLPVPQAEVIVTALNVRSGPGTEYPAIGAIRAGDVFDVLGINEQGDWLQIKTGDGTAGWIAGQVPYTRLIHGSLDNVPEVQVSSPAAIRPAQIDEPSVETGQLKGKLIFMTGSGGDLFVINVDGSGLQHLADGVIDPAVSPDGRQVAFTRWDGAEFGALYTINTDGTDERVILNDIRQPKSPAWSPDGQHIVIAFQHGGQRDPNERCRRFAAGQEINIPTSRINITDVDIGGDGSVKICYIPFEDLQWHLRWVTVSTGQFEDLPSDEYSYNPAWDPQNPWRVIYDGNRGLMQLDVTNGNRWPITEDVRDTGPVFSPDGQTLALTYKQHDHWEIHTYNLQTGERKRLTKPPLLADPQYNSAAPVWSPDGSQIAFVTDRTGRWEIWVMDVDGSRPRPLFLPEVQAQFNLEYRGVNERMLNWVAD